MLRDYEIALSNYRLISTDYKLDKAWKRYAGVQVVSNPCFSIVLPFGHYSGHYVLYLCFGCSLLWGVLGRVGSVPSEL